MGDSFSGTAGDRTNVEKGSTHDPRSTDTLVRWQRLADVGAALVVTSDASMETALGMLPSLLNRFTRPHQILDQLDTDVDGVLAGDTLAAGRLRERLNTFITSYPELVGSRSRAQSIVEASGQDYHADEDDERWDEGTISFDALVRLGAAAAMATLDSPEEALNSALDLVVGLALLASPADRLAQGLAINGPPGVAEAFNTLGLLSHWAAMALAPMRTMSGNFGGIPAGIPGGYVPGSGPIGGQLSGPRSPDEIPGFVEDIVNRLRDRRRLAPEILDRPISWYDIARLPPLEVIDRDEIRRTKCLLELARALKLRQEPPPPQPAIVVWSEPITEITPTSGCAGDQIVIRGIDFGEPDASIGVMLPMADGCHAFAVPAVDWTPTAIKITLPTGIASGTVGLVALDYVRAYDAWATRMNELARSIIDNAKCSRSTAPDVTYVPLFRTCAPLTSFNHLRGGLPVIWSFKANSADVVFVEPGQTVRLEWDLRNVEHFRLTHTPGPGPQFAATQFVDDPQGTQYVLGPFMGNHPQEAAYELRAEGPCGEVTSSVKVHLRKVPVLEIEGMEITQAIQTFRDPALPPNAVPLIAHKDTIVRVYVAVENLAGFGPNYVADQVRVTGRLHLVSPSFAVTLPPLDSSVSAQRKANIDRTKAGDTLNFRIPAALAFSTPSAYTTLSVDVWMTDEVEAPPTGVKTRPTAHASRSIEWFEKKPYRVRYVRISLDGRSALTDKEAREQIVRAFDLLPTVPTDLAPARVATWHTSVDIKTDDGMSTLLGHINDQHDCAFSEWLFPWEEECPNDDGAVWLGILPSEGNPAGITQSADWLQFIDRNTAIVSPSQMVIAHELGHTLSLKHVRTRFNCGSLPAEQSSLPWLGGGLDPLPNDGEIRIGDAFDPFDVKVVQGLAGLYDIMTYSCNRWVSRDNWMRLFGKF